MTVEMEFGSGWWERLGVALKLAFWQTFLKHVTDTLQHATPW